MEDVTYKSFRMMCKKFGADVMYTEFVSSEALIRDIEKSKQKMHLFYGIPGDMRLGYFPIQDFGKHYSGQGL